MEQPGLELCSGIGCHCATTPVIKTVETNQYRECEGQGSVEAGQQKATRPGFCQPEGTGVPLRMSISASGALEKVPYGHWGA